MTPYADNMEEFMKAAWPSTRLTVHVNGMSGDLVVSGLFLKRITRSCRYAFYLVNFLLVPFICQAWCQTCKLSLNTIKVNEQRINMIG